MKQVNSHFKNEGGTIMKNIKLRNCINNVDVVYLDDNYWGTRFVNAMTRKKGKKISDVIREGQKTFLTAERASFYGYSFIYNEKKDCLEIGRYTLLPSNNWRMEWKQTGYGIVTRENKLTVSCSNSYDFLDSISSKDVDLLCGESVKNIEKFFGGKTFFNTKDGSIFCFHDIPSTIKYIYEITDKYNDNPVYELGIEEIGKTMEIEDLKPIPSLFIKRIKHLISKKITGANFEEATRGLETFDLFGGSEHIKLVTSNYLYSFSENHGDINVIRVFRAFYDAPFKEIKDLELVEVARQYFSKESIKNSKNERQKRWNKPKSFSSVFVCYEKDGISNTPFAWIESALKNAVNNTKRKIKEGKSLETDWVEKFNLMISSPVIEKLYKSEYKTFSTVVLDEMRGCSPLDCHDEISEAEKRVSVILGKVSKKGKLHQQLGIPEALLKMSENKEYSSILNIFNMKRTFESCPEFFLRMNRDDLLYLYSFFKKMERCNYSQSDVITVFKKMIEVYGPKNFKGYIEYIKKNINKCSMTTYYEYLSRVYALKDVAKFDWKLSGDALCLANETIYDAYMMATNNAIYTQYVKGMKERQQELSKYEFRGKEFCVLPPKNPGDLVVEGNRLHHCAKTYMEAVSQGRTTILFVRKTKAPTTPYLTLEIRNNEIRQCHGANNSSLIEGTPAYKFIKNYCKDKKIKWANPDRILGA